MSFQLFFLISNLKFQIKTKYMVTSTICMSPFLILSYNQGCNWMPLIMLNPPTSNKLILTYHFYLWIFVDIQSNKKWGAIKRSRWNISGTWKNRHCKYSLCTDGHFDFSKPKMNKCWAASRWNWILINGRLINLTSENWKLFQLMSEGHWKYKFPWHRRWTII